MLVERHFRAGLFFAEEKLRQVMLLLKVESGDTFESCLAVFEKLGSSFLPGNWICGWRVLARTLGCVDFQVRRGIEPEGGEVGLGDAELLAVEVNRDDLGHGLELEEDFFRSTPQARRRIFDTTCGRSTGSARCGVRSRPVVEGVGVLEGVRRGDDASRAVVERRSGARGVAFDEAPAAVKIEREPLGGEREGEQPAGTCHEREKATKSLRRTHAARVGASLGIDMS